MFIIKNGEAYLIDGEKAKKATFSVDGLNVSDKEEDTVDIKGEQKYTYDEVYKKFNVAYFTALEKAKEVVEETVEEVKETKKTIKK